MLCFDEPRRGRPQRYPWDRLSDGQPHEITLLDVGASSWPVFRRALVAYVTRRQLYYRARLSHDGTVMTAQVWSLASLSAEERNTI